MESITTYLDNSKLLYERLTVHIILYIVFRETKGVAMPKRSVYDKTADLIAQEPSEVLRAVLERPYWPRQLDVGISYTRLGDDNRGEVTVTIAPDADAWITVFSRLDPEECGLSHRFRSGFGGGESERVRNALLALALAIKLDNRERPQDHRRKIPPDAPK